MPFDQSQVYQPDADTYLLLEAARQEVKPGDRILEVGIGSGLISYELAKVSVVVATDINPHAVLCASKAGIETVRTDLVSGLRVTFDLILFNPPYLPTQPAERIDDWLEYALDGGEKGRAVIERFARSVGNVLATEGRILLLVSSLTGIGEVQELFTGFGYSSVIVLQQEVEDEILFVLRIIRKARVHLPRSLVHLESNNHDIRDEDHAGNRHPLIKERHVPEEKYRSNKAGSG